MVNVTSKYKNHYLVNILHYKYFKEVVSPTSVLIIRETRYSVLSTNHSISEPTNQSVIQSKINQSNNQSTDQSINRSKCSRIFLKDSFSFFYHFIILNFFLPF